MLLNKNIRGNTDKPKITTLPLEILISILKSTNLPSLHNFSNVSSATYALVDGCLGDIFGFVLEATVPKEIQRVIKLTILIRSGAIPGDTLDDFRPYVRTLGKCIPTLSSPSIGVLRHILALSSVIDLVITPYCLKSLIQQCMTMQPRELVDKSFRYALPRFSPWRQRPEGQRYQPLNSGPPSQVEFCRVCRALWRIQMHSDLQKAHSQVTWPTSDITSLVKMNTIEFYSLPGTPSEKLRLHELEEVTTVYNWLIGQKFQGQHSAHQTSNNINNTTLLSLDQIIFRSLASPEDMTNYWADMPEADLNIPINVAVNWEDSVRYLGRIAPGQNFVELHLNRDWMSPIKNVPPHFFRRYGIALWDLKRLFALGLWTLPIAGNGSLFYTHRRGDLTYKWRSLLTEEELESVETKLEAGIGLEYT